MYELSREPGRACLVIKLRDTVGLEDYTKGMPELAKLVEETGARGILFDWTDLTGWDEEVDSLRFHAQLEIRNRFDRIAFIAESDWDNEVHRVAEVLNLPFRRFAPPDRQAALDWLESGT